jgi:WD40 repeat protein
VLGHADLLAIFDLTTLAPLRTLRGVACGESRLDLCFSPDGRFLAAGSEDGTLRLWDADSGAALPARVAPMGSSALPGGESGGSGGGGGGGGAPRGATAAIA